MTHEDAQNKQPEEVLREFSQVRLSLEQKLQKERLSRLLDNLLKDKKYKDLHEASKMLLDLFYVQKAASNFFMNEAANAQADFNFRV